MIKGCRKNVVYVRNTGSEMFDEAYFIVSEKGSGVKATESDMVREAGRIISEGPSASYFSSPKQTSSRKSSVFTVGKAAWFMLGASFTTALNALIYYIA
jgi:hypothetical protein